jgi:hypothetical protein
MSKTIERLRLLDDMILAKPLDTYSAVLFLPRCDAIRADRPGDSGDTFLAEVVAVGPGDRLIHGKCRSCGAEKRFLLNRRNSGFGECGACGSREWEQTGESRVPMHTAPGDVILVPRRPTSRNGVEVNGDCALMLDGERYLLFNEEQFALAKVEATA